MKARMMILKEYQDTRTGERFAAWRNVKGWRLRVLEALARAFTATRSTVQARAGYAAWALALVLVTHLLLFSGCSSRARVVEAADAAVVKKEVEFEANENVREVYYCGARTKGGKGCHNRVKRAGEHCWVHRDQPSEAK
jgi:hypothetical protein